MLRFKKLLMTLAALAVMLPSSADEAEDYRQFVDETREAVYSMDLPAFAVREIPERYKNESAVYVAVYNDLDARKKTGFGRLPGTLRFSRKARVEGGELRRVLIYINDKKALENFSEFDFATDMKKKMSNAHRRQRHTLGVRIIKPDGRTVDVNTDDFVEVAEGKKGKERRRKLAVPGLETGDMLDVFFYTEHKLQNVHLEPMIFCLRDEYPVMDYQIHAVVDDNLTTQYRTLNGAPDFTVTRDEDKNYVLDLKAGDIAAEPRLWYNDAEQSPMVKLYIFNRRSDAYTPWSARKDGLQANPESKNIKDDYWVARNSSMFYPAKNLVKDKIKNGDKAIKAVGKLYKDGKIDTVQAADYFYNLLSLIYLTNDIRSYWVSFDVQLAQLIKGLAKDGVQTVMTTDVDEEPLDRLISMYNVSSGSKLGSGSRYYFYPRAALSPSELHPDFAGRKAQGYNTEKYRKKHPEADTIYTVLSETTSADNRNVTSLKVSIDGTTADIHRRESYSGATKLPVQSLLTEEDVVGAYLAYLNRYGVELSLKEKKKQADDRAQLYETQRESQIDGFKNEIESYHGDTPTEFIDGSIEAVGIDPDSPEMIYNLHYRADGLVKRAGKNIVLSVGKLLSGQTELLATDRERVDDVVMRSPREFVTEISVDVPSGYKVSAKSLDELRCSVENSSGCFEVDAKDRGGTVEISITKRYNHRRENVAAWPQLTAILDAAAAWHGTNILLSGD